MDEGTAPAVEVEAPAVEAPEATTLEVTDAGVQEAPESLEAAAEAEATEGAPAAPDEAPVPTEAPLWADEQWEAWDGSRDSLDARYHTVFDRLSTQAQEAEARLQATIAERDQSIDALMWGKDDPQVGILRGQIAEKDTALAEANERIAAAQKALEDLKNEHVAEINAKADAEIARFNDRHAWALEAGTSLDVRNAIAELIDRGVTPTAAGDYMKDKPVAYQNAFAELVLAGANPEVAAKTAAVIAGKAEPAPLPEPLPGAEFVNGAGPAPTTARAPKQKYVADSVRGTRDSIAESLFAAK